MADRTSLTAIEYAVRIPASFVTSMRDSSIAHPTPLRNLHKDFMDLHDEMQVYVRIKPCDEKKGTLSITGNHIIVTPPKDSVSFKNRNNSGTKTLQKFKFNKIYDATVKQEHLFKDSALNLVQDFLMGKNALLFTYGATSAGKTYTMLGNIRDAGLIPRSLDVVFNSLEDRLLKNPVLKPLALNEVMKLNLNQIEAEELERTILMRGFDLDSSDTKDSISSVSSGSLKDWNIRARDETVCALQHPQDYFSVWVSYCEIYNEQAFDLLDGCDKKKKRVALRITEDRKGKFFVKGLKEICVRTADEAVRVLLFGKENLHFAATKLNHNSSRSHCIFTVKLIRTNHCDEPSEAAIHMMSFVDLAGMERTTKTQSKGERLKEAGNINTSLLILGRCIDAMRSNQQNSSNKTTMIPYRESKLTRILQHFFSGQGRAAMFVNVSPSANLCDETLHVLKFGALAQEIIIQPDRDASVADISSSQFAPPLRPSKFQQYVRKSISILSARASVLETSTFQAIGEEDDSQERIQELEEELALLKADWEENEQKVRDECCNEWIEIVTKMEKSWNQRYEDTKARYEEFCENRVDLMATLINSNVKNKKRKKTNEEDLEHMALKFKDKDDEIEILQDSNQHLQEQLEKLKDSLKASEESKGNLQKEMTRLQFEVAAASKPKINFCGPEVEDEEDVDEPHVNNLAKLKEQLSSKDEMLNEAVLEYHTKCEEMTIVQQENERLLKELEQTKETLSDVQAELEQSNLLLTNANERLDVREEELVNLEEKLMKANGQFGHLNTELREAKRRIRDLESHIKDQTNASMVSTMCEELQKQLLEAEAKLEKRQDEIECLKRELSRKDCIEVKGDAIQEELKNLRDRFSKVQIQLSISKEEITTLKEANEEMRSRRESLLDQISHLKKDIEISSTERKHDEGSQSHLLEENERMHKNLSDMKDAKAKLTKENAEFRKTMAEYEYTIEELTIQIGQLKTIKRERGLLEEELKTLAATLARVQLGKSQMEKEVDQIRNECQVSDEQYEKLQIQLEESRSREAALKEELKRLKEDLKCASNSTAGSVSEISSKEAELLELKEKLVAMKRLKEDDKLALEKEFNEKRDQLEKNNEKLTKEMLKHMRRADELSETIQSVEEKLKLKSQKCDSLSKRIVELENQTLSLTDIQNRLVDHEIALKEKENETQSVIKELEKKNLIIEDMKQQNERVLMEKNGDINRLENELKSILSGHVNYKGPIIKVEGPADDELHQDDGSLMVTPTPAKSRRGRPKKIASPVSYYSKSNAEVVTLTLLLQDSMQKEVEENKSETGSQCGSTRSRRTLKTEFAALPSSTKTSTRKPRKPKSDCEDVAHPAHFSAPHLEEDPSLEASTLGSSKRRLYNAKCPDILLPSSTKEEAADGLDFPKRMATRSRKP
ncbi:kinesin-like protein KIF20B isoform X1 [Daphnia pulex]|uniref:kinesin-like protein KIF20B isoform X1 n=1 Tax=Daphnia pulex TaxID=6669 RepID=UPI001EDCE5E1|nr:kinesin-like protein KIF20B isoform X1 [Daphnia pulex]